MNELRIIPSIEQLRQRPAVRALETEFGRDATIAALRDEADALRRRLASADRAIRGITSTAAAASHIEQALPLRLRRKFKPSLQSVINATGVVIHTNLGRAPLVPAATRRVAALATGYVNLEYDLASGDRGRRDAHTEALLCHLTGAEAALVVNNNAAATLLMLSALASGREVLISRGELVEIGGGFRVPDVMAQSGAILREVGTTNKTRIADYAAALGERTALILRVHPSNFRMEGFTERPSLEELVALGRRFNVAVAEDLGSGHLLAPVPGTATARVLADEPLVQSSIGAGIDLVSFSGDKLLGGPQAGIVVGRRDPLTRARQHPLMRALRVDKMTYAALEVTLGEYAAGRADSIPVVRMIGMEPAEIDQRVRRMAERLEGLTSLRAEIRQGTSTIGGGSAPGARLPTSLLCLETRMMAANELEAELRQLDPPVIARIEHDLVVLDLRTVLPEQDELLARLLATLPSEVARRAGAR